MNSKKIKNIAELTAELASKRGSLVLSSCSGSFDILHSGHISYLTEARAQGDILVVFLNSDKSIELYKGPGRPIIPLQDRIILLSALSCVDYIVSFDSLTPIELIKELKPEIFCNGSDWGENPVEKSVVEEYGGKFKIVSSSTRDKISTSEIIKKAHDVFEHKDKQVLILDRDGVLIADKGYVCNPNDVEISGETIKGLKKFRDAGFIFFVVTNQSGIGRGMFTEDDMVSVHKKINTILLKHNIFIKKYYYCPHLPADRCECRKPKNGMLIKLANENQVTLGKSWLIGDKLTDVEAGRISNMKTCLILNKSIINYNKSFNSPDITATDIDDAFKKIINLVK